MSNERYPAGKDYEIMYKSYFHRSPLELINMVEINKGDKIVDLCGGTGRLTEALLNLDLGCEITYVDISMRMLVPEISRGKFDAIQLDIETFLDWCDGEFNGFFCQQAVNYWLTEKTAELLAKRTLPGGFFVFNTFSQCPATYPMVREYEINDKKYIEVAYHIDGKVHHVQCCEGYEPHVTEFAYISAKQFKEWLGRYFKLTEHKKGSAVIWCAVRL